MHTIPTYNEQELLRLTAGGNSQAFARIYEHYRHKTYSYIFDLVKEQSLAEDVFQDVFTKIWEQRASLLRVENFNAYLFTVLKHRALDGLRRLAKEDTIIRELTQTADAANRETEDNLNYRELQKKLHNAIRRLPQQQRLVYTLSREDGLRQEEIAATLNIAPTTVNKHMTRALSFLRKSLLAILLLCTRLTP